MPFPRAAPSLRFTSLLYAGVLAGVSFIATPAKFRAESLSLGQLLEVGYHTFHAFGWIEWAFALALIGLALTTRRSTAVILAAVVVILIAAQRFLLMPPLDGRVAMIMDGGEVEPSWLHHAYAAIELAKFALLILLALGLGSRNVARR